jgi:hypothetical protein
MQYPLVSKSVLGVLALLEKDAPCLYLSKDIRSLPQTVCTCGYPSFHWRIIAAVVSCLKRNEMRGNYATKIRRSEVPV